MGSKLSLATVLEKNRLDSDVPFLLLLDIEVVNPDTGVVVEVLNVALNNEVVSFQGQAYEPAHFDVSFKQSANEQPQVTLEFNDFTGALRPRLEEYGGGVGFNVTMQIVAGNALDSPADIVEYFQVVSTSAADYRVTFELGAENEVMRTFPRRRQTRDFCQWRFKSPECGYVGPLTTCNLTLQGAGGCAGRSNTINFGGFPGINTNAYRYA